MWDVLERFYIGGAYSQPHRDRITSQLYSIFDWQYNATLTAQYVNVFNYNSVLNFKFLSISDLDQIVSSAF